MYEHQGKSSAIYSLLLPCVYVGRSAFTDVLDAILRINFGISEL